MAMVRTIEKMVTFVMATWAGMVMVTVYSYDGDDMVMEKIEILMTRNIMIIRMVEEMVEVVT